MCRSSCQQCSGYEEYYRLKLDVYLRIAKTSKPTHRAEAMALRIRLESSREEVRDAQRALLTHWKTCKVRQQSEARAALRMEPDQLPLELLSHKPAA